ncbi:hypothetical protein BDW22DRAFT_1409533 [Trametopsis cervina]|nr:hypothetical protein BDW22DRAFT_1409533 [Trametopsis cervina]
MPIVVDTFPGGQAGTTVNQEYDATTSHKAYQTSLGADDSNPYAPFISRMDWEIARWAKMRGPSSTALSELLSIEGLQEALGLSFKNVRELNHIIDSQLPAERPRFQRTQVMVAGEPHILYYRDIIECIRSLFGTSEFAQYLVFAPERHYTDETRTTRLYHDMHTGKWWWWTQEQLEAQQAGATVIPVILSSDKTQVTVFGGKSAYPVYLTIGNLPKNIRRKTSLHGHVLLVYLPVAKLDHVKNVASKRRLIVNLFHACMRKITRPLIPAGHNGLHMQSGDGLIRRTHPIVAAYACDYMEQIVVACCKMGDFPICEATKGELDDFLSILTALATFDSDPDQFTEACADAHIKPVPHPFWENLPHCNIFTSITPDILHQLHQGLVKHLLTWIKAAYPTTELDARCRRLPPNHHIRQFLQGFTHLKRLTGQDHADLARIILGLIIDLPLPGGRSSTSLIHFLYLSQYPVHSSQTLQQLHDALARFHTNKSIFETLDIRDSWEIPKLHFASHYLVLIKWLGTTDNFDTQYTERLHIDLAKDAYEATNHKDEFAQMTLWLERQEKINGHINHITWIESGKPQNLSIAILTQLPPRIHMTKNPTRPHVLFDDIIKDYHAPFIRDALARYIIRFLNPHYSHLQIEAHAIGLDLPFRGLPVYHRIKLWLGDSVQHHLSANEDDVVHARPARLDKYKNSIPGRFDTVLINDGDGEYLGVKGHRIGQVKVIFSLPKNAYHFFFSDDQQPPKYLAYIEWFKPFRLLPQPNHLLYRVTRSLDASGDRLASIVPVDCIRRSIALFPSFSSSVPREWTSSNILDECSTFYVNSFSDRHSYHTVI